LDDEYFRTAMASLGYPNEIAKAVWKERVVASQFSRRPALKKVLAESIFPISVETPAGIYLGQAEGVKFEAKRINRVIEKILRGLYRHHYPEVILGSEVSIETNMLVIDNKIGELVQQLRHEQIGGDTFHYWRGVAEEDGRESLWVFAFYTRIFFSAATSRISGFG
jgi:hypothetical protein